MISHFHVGWTADSIANDLDVQASLKDIYDLARTPGKYGPIHSHHDSYVLHPDSLPFNQSIIRQALFQAGILRFDKGASLEDLDLSIRIGEEALKDLGSLPKPAQPSIMNNLGFMKTTRYNLTGITRDLNDAVELCKEAVTATELTNEERLQMLENLGYCLSARYDATGDLGDLDYSIVLSREVLELSKTNSIRPPHHYFINLSARLYKRFIRTSKLMDETESIDLTHRALATLEAGTLIHAVVLHNLGIRLFGKFRKTRFRRDLEDVIRIFKIAYSECPRGYEERGAVALNLGESLMDRYELTKDLNDLKGAIEMSKEAVELGGDGSLHRASSLRSWVTQLNELFLRTNTKEDLDIALNAVTEALASPLTVFSTRLFYLRHAEHLLGSQFLQRPSFETYISLVLNILNILSETPAEQRSEKFKNEEYRHQCIRKLLSQFHRIGTGVLEGERDRIGVIFLRTMHRELTDRCKTMGFADAWAEAVNGCVDVRFDVYGGNSDIVDADGREFIKQLASLGLNQVRFRYRLLGGVLKLPPPKDTPTDRGVKLMDLTALGHAIHQVETELAQASKPENIVSRGYRFARLAQLQRDRSLQTSSLEDFDKAVSSAESANSLVNDTNSSPQTQEPILFVLAMTLKARYQRQGDVKDLERCITCAEKAIKSIDHQNSKDRAGTLNNYALIMRLSYQRTHALGDIDKALDAITRAMAIERTMFERTGQPAWSRAMTLNNEGIILEEKYERTRDLKHLSDAIQSFRKCLDITSEEQSRSSEDLVSTEQGTLLNLAIALSMRYEHTGSSEDLDEAIRYGTTRAKDGDFIFNDNMSHMFYLRYKRDGTPEDLNRSIQYARDGTDCTPTDHPDRAYCLERLGDALAAKVEQHPSQEAVLQCIQAYTQVWDYQIAKPLDRIQAAWKAGRVLYQDKRYKEAADMVENAIVLMPRLGPRWVGRDDQQNRLITFTGLPGDAALVTLQAGRDPSQALRLLEFGRGIMMGIQLDNRSEILHVEGDEYPELFRRFNTLRVEVEVVDTSPLHRNTELDTVGRRREVIAEMERLLEEIRRLPGHEGFLLPPKPDDLMKMAVNGPIVVVCTSSMTGTGAAIIVQTSRISSLSLPKLSHAEVTERMDEMARKILKASLKTAATRNEKMRALLMWLWEAAVEPVLGELGYMGNNGGGTTLPHVRWMGVGPLSNAPFHAAGDSKLTSGSNTMHRVISSYLPTLRALAYSHERKPKKYLNRKRDTSLLVVSMPETPGAGALPSVDVETIFILATALGASIRTTLLRMPTAAQVLEQLPMNNIVHFACHGVSDRVDPSNSHLILADAPLTVSQILRNHAAEPDLAFLSACSTAHNRAAHLADESIHIANSFQQVGFRHVVGGLWTAEDEVCQKIARAFYVRLFEGEEDEWDGASRVAEALHFAVSSVREEDCDFPLLWAPFVVFGG